MKFLLAFSLVLLSLVFGIFVRFGCVAILTIYNLVK